MVRSMNFIRSHALLLPVHLSSKNFYIAFEMWRRKEAKKIIQLYICRTFLNCKSSKNGTHIVAFMAENY